MYNICKFFRITLIMESIYSKHYQTCWKNLGIRFRLSFSWWHSILYLNSNISQFCPDTIEKDEITSHIVIGKLQTFIWTYQHFNKKEDYGKKFRFIKYLYTSLIFGKIICAPVNNSYKLWCNSCRGISWKDHQTISNMARLFLIV